MNILLKNSDLLVEIRELGAEIVQIKNLHNDLAYIWHGDPKYWSGHAPVLFPIVGNVANGEIRVDGITYQLKNHGFARKETFELVSQNNTTAQFKLISSERTLSVFPYHFELVITYTLANNQLNIDYLVNNIDSRDIYFQLGTHTAINCPINKESAFQDYFLDFEEPETLIRYFMAEGNVFKENESEIVIEDETLLPLNHSLFYDGSLIMKETNSNKVTLKNYLTDHQVVFTYTNFPTMVLWQPKDAPFICIEPWHGYPDTEGFIGEFKERDKVISLQPNQRFQASLHLQIF
ncbi:aldose 1-epimerase family protein [Bacillus kwashiorkori]|uniref:aldose 1-epimerase family protein n=1 Tax=Bacillus kwashiorkori TaxID=1522318 RepID=UPI000784A444|nr:aldose 1-epimerase family protein [Bacillus kwashiorkori]